MVELNVQKIRQAVVTLQPELKIGFKRGFNDQGKTGCKRSFEMCFYPYGKVATFQRQIKLLEFIKK